MYFSDVGFDESFMFGVPLKKGDERKGGRKDESFSRGEWGKEMREDGIMLLIVYVLCSLLSLYMIDLEDSTQRNLHVSKGAHERALMRVISDVKSRTLFIKVTR